MLGLLPGEFWELTPYEMRLMLEAAGNRETRDRRFAAAMVASQLNCWVKNRITVDDLLGIQKPEEKKRARMAWLEKPLDQMSPSQRKRLQKHLAGQRAERERLAAEGVEKEEPSVSSVAKENGQ